MTYKKLDKDNIERTEKTIINKVVFEDQKKKLKEAKEKEIEEINKKYAPMEAQIKEIEGAFK